MDYFSIVDTALIYTDRATDPEVTGTIDSMLRIVEARINRNLTVMASSSRTRVAITDSNQEYYDLPSRFSSFRSIKIITDLTATAKRYTLEYVTPVLMDERKNNGLNGNWYTIEANKIWIRSDNLVVGNYIEYVNYADLAPLTSSQPTNWLSLAYPDCYIAGLAAEISLLAKDWDLHARYSEVFKSALDEVVLDDSGSTWSGGILEIRTC